MEKSNIIISIIIVLCIAAAVTAYGVTNSNNPIFSDLSSVSGTGDNTGNGIGNNTTAPTGNDPSTATSSGGSGSGSSNTGSSSGTGSGSGSGSGSGGSGSGSGSGSGTHLSYSEAKSIASSAIGEPGCYAGQGYYSGGYWIFPIYDEEGNVVDSIGVNDATGQTERV